MKKERGKKAERSADIQVAKLSKDLMSVGVFVIVRGDANSFLLVKHNYGERKWSLPGGALKPQELATDGACREAMEESGGLEIKIIRQIGIFTLRKRFGLVILFEGVIVRGTISPDKKEISDCGFFHIDDINTKEIYPAQLSLVLKSVEAGDEKQPVYGWLIPPVSN